MIEVQIADDSAVVRGLYARMLEAESDIKVTATAANGEQAIKVARSHPPDVMILDLEMPVMDGFSAIPHLLAAAPGLQILVASSLSSQGAEISLRCLRSGAADYLAKPSTTRELVSGPGGSVDFRSELILKVRALGGRSAAKRERKAGGPPVALAGARSVGLAAARPAMPALRTIGLKRPEILAIGSSTGGPQALFTALQGLGKDYPLPVVITQHMPATFTRILAGHITSQTGIPCSEGFDGAVLTAGHAFLAPGNFHMTIEGTPRSAKIKLNSGPLVNFCRPAVDPMFQSVAAVFGSGTLAAVLTGMGADGCRGGEAIVSAGGTLIAQDEETSVVWGMPGAVAKAGICSAILPIDKIGAWINARTKG